MAKSRAPIVLPGYALGDDARPDLFTAAIARETAALEAKELEVGDAAFILRSGHKWAYAVVIEKEEKEGDGTTLRFEVDAGKNRKTFPEAVWGKYIRVIKADASEMAKLEAEAGAADHVPKQEAKKGASKSPTLVLGEFSSEVGSWFSSKWGSKKKSDATPDAAEKKKNSSGPVPASLSLESKASSSQENKPAMVTAASQEDKPAAVASKGATIPPQIGALLSSVSTSVSSICGQLKGEETALCNALKKEKEDEEGKAATATVATEEKGSPEPESGEPKTEPAAAAAEVTDESKIESAESKTIPKDEGEVAIPEPADATEEKSEPTPELEDAKIEKGESAESETTATKTKEKSKLGSRISNMVGKVSGGLKPKKKDKTKAAVVATAEEMSKAQIDNSELAKTKTDESEPATPAASPDFAPEENTSSVARAPSPDEAPGAGAQKPAPVLDETRDATEDMPSLVPTSSDGSARKSPAEETSTSAPPAPAAGPSIAPVPAVEPPAPEPEQPKPIKLLKTPFKFYKARSMKDDPAAAALAATSFADDLGGYDVIQSHGVAVCNHDPAAAANANILAQERASGRPEIPQDILIKEHNAELKRQGIAIVEAE